MLCRSVQKFATGGCDYTCDVMSVTNYILFCSTPELGALAPFVFEMCGPFYIYGAWPWH